MLIKEQVYKLSETIGVLDTLASMVGQSVTITDAMSDLLCDVSDELNRLRSDLMVDEPKLEIPVEIEVVHEEKKPLTLDEKQEAIERYCSGHFDCTTCPLSYWEDNKSTIECYAILNKIEEFFDALVREGELTPDGKIVED